VTKDTYYLTTPIYYVNDVPHIGHAYCTVVADTIARHQRLNGRRVHFLTGTDEHGQKIERAARKQGLEPRALVDSVVNRFQQLWKRLEISHDEFIRTTEPRHHQAVAKLFDLIRAKGDIYLGRYRGWYCTGCEAFYTEAQIVEGRCPEQGHPVEELEEESYFFRLSRYQDALLQHYDAHPEFVRPESRLNEVREFVRSGLKDLSISRTGFRWGIPVPGDEQHVVYVWFDALTNYLTAAGYGADDERLARLWPADLHLVGKDILRFHAVYWPAFLMSAGLPLPRQIFGHGWWLTSEGKMSKSRGKVVDPLVLINQFGVDPLRYFLMREMTFGQDAAYSDEALIDRINSDLANDLGNLAQRTLAMVHSYSAGAVDPPSDRHLPDAAALADLARRSFAEYRARMDAFEFQAALTALWELVGGTNRFLVRHEPWKTPADEAGRQRRSAVLSAAVEALRWVAHGIAPVMPESAATLLDLLGFKKAEAQAPYDSLHWGDWKKPLRCRKAEALFPRIDKEAYFEGPASAPGQAGPQSGVASAPGQAASSSSAGAIAGQAQPAAGAAAPSRRSSMEQPAEQLSIDEFRRLQLRTGRVVSAQKVAGADRLLELKVDLGTETRTIVAGIAERYAPESLVGKNVVIVANLKPARIRGVESQGMLLAATVDDKPVVCTFEEPVPPGATVR
jgi:methionyl-tRNA synthetase